MGKKFGGGKTPFTIWHIQTGTMMDVIQDSVDRFAAENPQYEVTVVQKQNDSYKIDLSLAINAGTMPDVFITWGGQTLYDYVDAGLVYDLTSLMKANSYADQFLVLGTLGNDRCSVSSKNADSEGAFKLIQFLLDDQAQTDRTAQGKIIPMKSFTSNNAVVNKVLDSLNSAGGVQLWYDQYLPAQVAGIHKKTGQAIFGLTTGWP